MNAKERAEERRRRPGTMARLIRLKDADRSFDYEFWQNLSGEERLGAMWQLVVDMRILRGENEVEPRLLRHVQNVQYRNVSALVVRFVQKKAKKFSNGYVKSNGFKESSVGLHISVGRAFWQRLVRVVYLIVGAHAVGFHVEPQTTRGLEASQKTKHKK